MWSRSPDPPPPPPIPADGDRLAELQQSSTDALLDAIHRGPEVRRTAETFRTMRRENGFEALLMRGLYPK